jgi:hypothetical protein
VAFIPNDDTAENHQYSLILEGYAQPLCLNSQEANSVKKHLQVDTEKKYNGTWDREEQIRLNQPKLKKLKEKIDRMKQEQPSEEKAEFFESFKRTMDAHRPEGRKLYEH